MDVGIYPFIHQIDRCHVLLKNNAPATWKNQGKSLDASILFYAYPLIMPASTVYVLKAIDVSIHQQQDARIDPNIDCAVWGWDR